MEDIKISVIVPVYNVKDFFDECLCSLVSQTYKNIEILLVDDGSSDGTEKLCDEWEKRDSRIKVFHKENGGTHTARNLGLQNATGEYVTFIDPDDWLDLNIYEICMAQIVEHGLDVVRFNYVREYAGQSLGKENTFVSESVCSGEDCKKVLRQTVGLIGEELSRPDNMNFLASVCFAIYRKEIIDKHNLSFYNIRKIGTFSDGLFNVNYLLYADKFLFINKDFYHYRKTNTQSATVNYRKDFLQKQILLFEELQTLLQQNGVWGEFEHAFYNRVAFSAMEMCLNAFQSKTDRKSKCAEIKEVLNNEICQKALKQFPIRALPIKWKVYFYLLKHRFVGGVYALTKVMQFLRTRGKV